MNTSHRIFFQNAKKMKALKPGSIDLVVTSPPYPMIEMWDDVFKNMNPKVKTAFKEKNGNAAFELMHQSLDAVWDEVVRVLKNGGFACINIGDAVRTINDHFRLYPNHARILSVFHQKGLSPLPIVIWRKQTNAPNKFMGSGVLPAGAYVTLEHEYILVLRKGGKRTFDTADDRAGRQNSALFWEERNQWFSDVWMDLKGTRQDLIDKSVRKRSAAFPFELPYRLINMYSVKGDTVLDPFLGTGTTMFAAMATCRNSVGVEIDKNFLEIIDAQFGSIVGFSNNHISERLRRHEAFVKDRIQAKGPLKHTNQHYGFPVIMNQEKNLMFNPLQSAGKTGEGCFEIKYSEETEIKKSQQPEYSDESGKKRFQQLELKI
ncbi:MAG: site-specific DNA-methyltransferase [Desulfobacteraceae bacterium]|nr:site-specific DNA-methyltransferase [Desulfobacteraceae bacterium]MBC2755991.1 site-specific DNA-methyltransferase [Desulfobacteraceae bacterium]